jgi:predicted nucleic acid-binding protein
MEGINTLPVDIIPEAIFKGKLEIAQKQIGKRDPTDVDLLALALAEHLPIWSDDKDFEESTAEILTTEDIIEYTDTLT